MPKTTPIDLAQASSWRGVAPGLTREQAIAILAEQQFEPSPCNDRTLLVSTDDWEMELVFTDDGTERLQQISMEGGDLRWGDQPIVDVPVDAALEVLGANGQAFWTANDASCDPFPDANELPAESSEAQLLTLGTIWLPDRGLGLVVYDAVVLTILRRGPADLPAHYAGQVTAAQRELSLRPDIETHLRGLVRADDRAAKPHDPLRIARIILTLTAVASVAWIAREGFFTAQRWHGAQQFTGKLVAIERVPMKQFRDFLPPAMRWPFPRQRDVIVNAFRVGYTAPDGRAGEVLLERGELYVPPEQIGENVPLAWLDGDPPQVKGLARAQDSAFLVEYVPLAIGVGVLYLLALVAVQSLPLLRRLLTRATAATSPPPVRE